MRRPLRFTLQEAVTKAASYSLAPSDHGLSDFDQLIFTLQVTAAEDGSGDETYDFYVTTELESGAKWDVVHFPQVTVDGVYSYVARAQNVVGSVPLQVTTAAPGVASIESGTIAVASGQANAIQSLGVGRVRAGAWGDKIGYELVVGGTVATGISYSIRVEGL